MPSFIAAHVDPAARRRELESVGKKVQEDLLHFAPVPADHAHTVVDARRSEDDDHDLYSS